MAALVLADQVVGAGGRAGVRSGGTLRLGCKDIIPAALLDNRSRPNAVARPLIG
jgi:hypothetical protein